MASEQHITLLRQGFKVWNLWRQQNPQSIPELKGADLTGLNLVKVDLSGTDLSEVDFSGTSLYQANLSGANLYKANLSTAILQEADLSGASLIEANLKDKKFPKTNLSGADLSRANLSGAKFYTSTNLNNTNFKSANLSNSDLREPNLRYSNFIGANLSKANLSATNLNSANCYGVDLCEANLNAANLDAADFCGANLSEANLEYASLRGTQIQEVIIDEKWYLVWDIVNNGGEGRDFSKADLSGADLSYANFKNGDLSGADLSRSILNRADFSWTDLSRVNFRKANLAGANFDWAYLSEADLCEVKGFDSITDRGANFTGAIFRETTISSDLPDSVRFPSKMPFFGCRPTRNAREFFSSLISWKNQEVFNELIKKSLFSSQTSFIPGVLLYTDEDHELSLYVREHFDALDKLTGYWCTIYLLENPSLKWRKANQNWIKTIKASLHETWFRSKPYDKSEAYDIARQLNIESSSLPCLVLISPTNLSEKLVLQIREVSPEYFRKLFSTLEKLVKRISSEKLSQREASSQVFDYLKLNFNEVVNFLEKHAIKQENDSTKYILEGDNISVLIEPVNIGNVNYNEKIEGDYVQGDCIDKSRNLKVGNVGRDFKPFGSALMADGFRADGTVAESINIDQDMPEGEELQNRQDEKSSS